MKKFFGTILTVFLFSSIISCTTLVDIEKEKPAAFKTKKIKTIYVGWLDLPAGLWKPFGYESRERWLTEVRGNNAGIRTYLREYMPDKKIKGADKKPASGDIYITFKYFDFDQKYNSWGAMDEMKVGIEFIDIRSGKSIYKGVIITKSGGVFPRNWKGSTLDGRLDNMMYNIAGFIAGKLQ